MKASSQIKYNISGIKYSQSQYYSRLGIGYILQCNKGDNFGVIYGYRNHGRSHYREKTWLYFFKKRINSHIEKLTPVTFLQSSSGWKEDELYEVTDIVQLNSYIIINNNDTKTRGKERKREDGIYRYDKEWDLMCSGTPYISLFHGFSANYPVVDPKSRTIVFHDYTVFSDDCKYSILSCIIGLYNLREYSQEPQFDYVNKKLDYIKEYISKFKLSKELRKFCAGESGYFQSRPGRDDHFNFTKYWTTTSEDSYMKTLTNLHEEKDYYTCCGRGVGDNDYDRVDENETRKMRLEIKQKYDKNAHYIFLIDEFFSNLKEKRNEYLSYEKALYSFIEEGDEYLFESEFASDYLSIIQEYNSKRK